MESPSPVVIGPDEKRSEMERVLRSHTFSRSDQLKRFLQYICEKEIAEKADEINEYSIAVEALGRPADYSPVGDSSVRTRAHALRQKLQEYYEVEHPEAELRIDMPRGGYNPQFIHQVAAEESAPEIVYRDPAALRPSATPPIRTAWRHPAILGAGLLVALAAGYVLGALSFRSRSAPPASALDRTVANAWGQMLTRGERVDVWVATPPAMLLHSYRDGKLPVEPSPLWIAPKDVKSWYENLQMLDGGGKLYMHTTQDVFLFGDSLAATSAVQFLSRWGAAPRVEPEANLRAFALRGRNVVLIGSPNYSPLAARFLMNTPFSVRYDPICREEVISDGAPEAGAKRIFRPTRNALHMITKAYGLVTVLPSEPAEEGNAKTIIFSGITSAGPQAGLEFFRSPEGLRILELRLQKEGYRKFPPAYQVVVRCGLDHNLALNWEYETHQVMKESPLLR